MAKGKKKYNIIIPKPGADDEFGATTRLYTASEQVNAEEKWQEELMETFVANGWAEEIKVDAPVETKRARNDKGQLQADDPTTPDVNEAWEGGKAPAKKKKTPAKKKTAKKKTAKKAKS
jgi:hypothetical protein